MYCDECKDQAASEKGNLIVEMSKVADERDKLLLQISELQKRCEELSAQLVDAGALHLADEQSLRNMDHKSGELIADVASWKAIAEERAYLLDGAMKEIGAGTPYCVTCGKDASKHDCQRFKLSVRGPGFCGKCLGPVRWGKCWGCMERLNKELQNKVTELLPVAYAAIGFWRSDKGDTKAESYLFKCVEAFESKDGNDILMWQIEEERRNKTERPNNTGAFEGQEDTKGGGSALTGKPPTPAPSNFTEKRVEPVQKVGPSPPCLWCGTPEHYPLACPGNTSQ